MTTTIFPWGTIGREIEEIQRDVALAPQCELIARRSALKEMRRRGTSDSEAMGFAPVRAENTWVDLELDCVNHEIRERMSS